MKKKKHIIRRLNIKLWNYGSNKLSEKKIENKVKVYIKLFSKKAFKNFLRTKMLFSNFFNSSAFLLELI